MAAFVGRILWCIYHFRSCFLQGDVCRYYLL